MADAVLKQMILDAPTQVENIDSAITNIDEQIADFQSKQDSLVTVCDTVAIELETYLKDTKFSPETVYYMYKGINFNQNLDISGSIIDWKIYKILSLTGLIFVSDNTFTCNGDKTSTFSADADLSIILGGGRVYSTVASSSFDGSVTEVILNDSVLDVSLTSVWLLNYIYILGDDPIIDSHKDNWDFSHDYITLPLGISGSYGTKDNITQLNVAKNLLNSNRTKFNDSITVLAPFV